MWVCSVDVGGLNVDKEGNPEPLQIVCGAQNFNEGDHIVTAMVGAELPGDVKIKKSKLRGVASFGMNCSARELRLKRRPRRHHDLARRCARWASRSPSTPDLTDTVLDLEITPNRPD